jgi:hypothetical protein
MNLSSGPLCARTARPSRARRLSIRAGGTSGGRTVPVQIGWVPLEQRTSALGRCVGAPVNRSIAFLGIAVLLLGIGFLAYPIAVMGFEQVDAEQEVGILVLSASASIILWGMTSPDPAVTTVSGLFGNPDENELRRRLRPAGPGGPARYLPSPRESVNCSSCYTAMPAQQVLCPRCGERRTCRRCGKPLFQLAGAVRCGPCVKDEVYCHCPKLKRGQVRHLRSRPRLR